jgi:hypothetical protein
MSHGAAYLSFSPRGKLIFLFLGEVRPFCILSQTHPANKARNRPCSISRAERTADWPKFFATFQQYSCPSLMGTPVHLSTSAEGDRKKAKRQSASLFTLALISANG